jgi:amino acid adenylation domain-containing protein
MDDYGTTRADTDQKASVDGESNLTTNQLIFLVGQKMQPDVPLYNMAHTFHIKGSLDPQHFKQAFQTLLNSSDVLRTVFVEEQGIYQQKILDNFAYSMNYEDFSGSDDPETKLEDWVDQRSRILFDFEKCLFDSALLKLSLNEFVWYLNQHHIICDATSTSLVFRHMSDLYGRAIAGRLPEKIDLPSFQEYVRYEREQRSSERYREAKAYWERKLHEELEPIMFYGKTPVKSTTRVQRVSLELGADRSKRLKKIASQEGFFLKTLNVSLFNIFAALLLNYLYRISGNRRLSLGIPFHNRHLKEFKQTMGLFVEVLPLRISVEEKDTFMSLIHKIAAEAAETLKYSQYAIANSIANKVYDVSLNYQVVSFSDFNGYEMHQEWLQLGHGNESLTMQVHDFDDTGNFILHLDLHCDVYNDFQREQAAEHFLQLIDTFIEDSFQLVSEVNLSSEKERQRLLVEWNDTAADFPQNRCIHEIFEEQVEARPDSVALVFEDKQLTYRELNNRANQLANHLQSFGVKPETLVAICAERGLEFVIGILGILKVGGAYVPLDPEYPKDRLAFMLEDMQTPVVLTTKKLLDRLPKYLPTTLYIDEFVEDEALIGNPDVEVSLENLAYVIYTSGSTGRPKGTMIEHQSVVNLMYYLAERFAITAASKVLQFASISFDASVTEIFPTFLAGATLHLARQETLRSSTDLVRLLREQEISIVTLPPSLLSVLPSDDLPALRTLISAGEPCSWDSASRWAKGRLFLNGYGPTETTVAASYYLFEKDQSSETQSLPIGRPISNVEIFILDQKLEPAPVGVPGELHIGGLSLGRGYLNRPELTAEKFIPHPFSIELGARLYKTGDLARYSPNGDIEFLGRIDHQVKVRGFRIELGEIEAVLRQHPATQDVVVLSREDSPADKRLVAYLVIEESDETSAIEFRSFLKEKLPEYMIPSAFVMLDKFPLTPNNKVDLRNLPAPDGYRQVEETFVAPRNATEEVIAEIWQEILGIERIGIYDSYFELGGDSLQAMRLMERINSMLKIDIPLHVLLEAKNVKQFAEKLATYGGSRSLCNLTDVMRKSKIETAFEKHEKKKPRTETERLLLEIWKRKLNVRSIGIRDSFFDLQGESDLLDSMLTEIRNVFWVFSEGFPVNLFLKEPTIEAMARIIDDNIEQKESSLVVCLQPQGSKNPLFMIHAGGGYVFFYRALALHLGRDRPFYCIRAETNTDGLGQPFSQSRPYYLGGACVGGIIAFEMAKQLQSQGEEMAGPLLLIDSYILNNPHLSKEEETAILQNEGFELGTLRDRITHHLIRSSRLGLVNAIWYLSGKILRNTFNEMAMAIMRIKRSLLAIPSNPFGKIGSKAPLNEIEQMQRSFMTEFQETSKRLQLKYVPSGFKGSIVLFKAEEIIGGELLWNNLASEGMTVHQMPGGHLSMMNEPMVITTAARIRECLQLDCVETA